MTTRKKNLLNIAVAAISAMLLANSAGADSLVNQKIHPVVSLTGGFAMLSKISNSTNINIPEQGSNTYTNHTSASNPLLLGVFAGVEFSPQNTLIYQVGLSYSLLSSRKINGTLYQLSDPSLGNFDYQYSVASQVLLLDSKLLFTTHKIFHPYVSLGLGTASNRASGYSQTANTPGAFDPDAPFSNGTSSGFAYALGFGVDTNVAKNFRIGLGYRYANLGNVKLGSSATLSSGAPETSSLNTNEILLQLTYVI